MMNSCCSPMMWWPRQLRRMLMEAGCRPRYSSHSDYRSSYADNPAAAPVKKDIIDTALAAGKFTALISAAISAGLAEPLKGAGTFTVFAPTDQAFASLPTGTVEELLQPANKARLQALLSYHAIPGRVTASELAALKSVKTLGGKELPVSVDIGAINGGQLRGSLRAGNAVITRADIDCTNGIIHVIDRVITAPAE